MSSTNEEAFEEALVEALPIPPLFSKWADWVLYLQPLE
jgi:hypothetical protein